jgi:hypothetical protein
MEGVEGHGACIRQAATCGSSGAWRLATLVRTGRSHLSMQRLFFRVKKKPKNGGRTSPCSGLRPPPESSDDQL